MSNDERLNVRDFGAVGNGKTDDTEAFRLALAAAEPIKGTVFVPDGVYMCATIKLPTHTGLLGNASWGYREGAGSLLRLNDAQATCLIDLTGAVGASVHGLSLDGAGLGTGVHGIHLGPFEGKKEEDSPFIDRCHISRFTGNGIHLAPIWCFSVRHCEIFRNKGHALYVKGCDGFVLDNWFTGNEGCGFAALGPNDASVTMTGNRMEWNHGGGIRILGGSHYNITGNYIDRSGGPGISLLPHGTSPCLCMTITGNVIYRSGKPEWTTSELDSCHARIEECHGIVFSGNSMCVGQDDGSGKNSPQFGLVLRALKNCVIKDNALHIGAIKELVHDLGSHGEGVKIADNVGNLFIDDGRAIWASGQL